MARILRLFSLRYRARRAAAKGVILIGPHRRTLGDKLQILARTNPEGLRVLEHLVDDMLHRAADGD